MDAYLIGAAAGDRDVIGDVGARFHDVADPAVGDVDDLTARAYGRGSTEFTGGMGGRRIRDDHGGGSFRLGGALLAPLTY